MNENCENIEENYQNLSWDIIKTYFEGKHLQQLIRHQIESFNNFINYQIPKTIEMFNPVVICSEMIIIKL